MAYFREKLLTARAVDFEAEEPGSSLGRDAQHSVILGKTLNLPMPNKMRVSVYNETGAALHMRRPFLYCAGCTFKMVCMAQ